ncbi:MAG: PQQ-binding-like beta-propeller repeat protein [Planctomycetota bacterium]
MISSVLMLLACVGQPAEAPEAPEIDNRTQIMAVDRELSELLAQSDPGSAARERALLRLVRHGRTKLVGLPDDPFLFVNARDHALEQLLVDNPEEDARAQELLDSEGVTPETVERLLSRHPRSKALLDALTQGLKTPLASTFRMECGALVRLKSIPLEPNPIISPAPVSTSMLSKEDFPLEATWKLKVSGPAFRPAFYEGLQRGIVVKPYYPLIHLKWDGGLFLSDPRGFKQLLFDKVLTQNVMTTPDNLLNHLDNNISGDFLLHKDWAYVPMRSSPMIRDTQKDLYYVELSRHKIAAFKVGEQLVSSAEDPGQQSWRPVWSLQDDALSFNATPAVAGPWMLAAGSSLVGLFNVELACVDRLIGKTAWRVPLASGQQELNYFGRHIRECQPGVPFVSGDRVWVTSNLGSLHCLDLAGRPLWARLYTRCPTPEPRQYYAHVDPRLTRFRNQPPVIDKGRLYVAPVDSPELVCLDAGTGKKIWSYTAFDPSEGFSRFWIKVYWQVLDEGVLLVDMNGMLLLNREDGSVIKRIDYPNNYVNQPGKPLICRNAIVLASSGSLLVYARKTFDLIRRIDLGPKIVFGSVNMDFDGKRLAIVDGRLNSPEFEGHDPGELSFPGYLWILEAAAS